MAIRGLPIRTSTSSNYSLGCHSTNSVNPFTHRVDLSNRRLVLLRNFSNKLPERKLEMDKESLNSRSSLCIPLPGTSEYEFATYMAGVEQKFWQKKLQASEKATTGNTSDIKELQERVDRLEEIVNHFFHNKLNPN